MIQLLRSELQAPQLAQVAKDFMVFAFECAERPSIGNPEDEALEFEDFCAAAKVIPGIGQVLNVDVMVPFESEREMITADSARMEADQAAKDAEAAAKPKS